MLYHFLNFFGLVNKVFADSDGGTESPGLTNPLKSDSIVQLITNLLDIVVKVGIPVIALAIVYAGFLFVKAQGNESKITEAKEVLFYTLIGAAIVLGATIISGVIEVTVKSL